MSLSGFIAVAALFLGTTRDAQLQAARDLQRAGQHDASIAACRRLLAEAPDDAEVRGVLGFSLLHSGRPQWALVEFSRVLERYPMDGDVRGGAIDALMRQQRWKEAFALLEAAPDSEQVPLLERRARLHLWRGDYQSAQRAVRRGLALPGASDELRELHGQSLLQEVRLTVRTDLHTARVDNLHAAELGYLHRFDRWQLGLTVLQTQRFASTTPLAGYNAMYGLAATRFLGTGKSLALGVDYGLPVSTLPFFRAKLEGTAPVAAFATLGSYSHWRFIDGGSVHIFHLAASLALNDQWDLAPLGWFSLLDGPKVPLTPAATIGARATFRPKASFSFRIIYTYGGDVNALLDLQDLVERNTHALAITGGWSMSKHLGMNFGARVDYRYRGRDQWGFGPEASVFLRW